MLLEPIHGEDTRTVMHLRESKNTIKMSYMRSIWSLDSDLNSRPPEYEIEDLSTRSLVL